MLCARKDAAGTEFGDVLMCFDGAGVSLFEQVADAENGNPHRDQVDGNGHARVISMMTSTAAMNSRQIQLPTG